MILVLGGRGQLGRALAAHALAEGMPLTAFGRDQADVTDPKAVAIAVTRVRPSLIINAAGLSDVDRAEQQPAAAQRVNALGAAVVAAAAKRSRIPLIHISNGLVFNGAKFGPYTEDDPVGPVNALGRSKAKGEEGVRNAHADHLIIRTSWLFSADGIGFLQDVLKRAAERDAFDVATDRRGSPTAAADLAEAVMIAAAAALKGKAPWGTYHVAGLGETSLHGWATAIVALQAPHTGRVPMVNVTTTAEEKRPTPRSANAALDSSKFAQAFGYRPDDWHLALDKVVTEIFSAGKAPVRSATAQA